MTRWPRIAGLAMATVLFLPGSVLAQATQPVVDDVIQATETKMPEEEADSIWEWKKLTGTWGGVRDDLKEKGFRLSLSWQLQFQQNFKGGLETHNADRQSGSYDMKTLFDFGKMGLIPNAGFYLKAKGGLNKSIEDDVGTVFADPNTDAYDDEPIYVSKWWYWHKFWDELIEVRLGVIESKKDLFDVSMYANHEDKHFMNKMSNFNITIPHDTGMGAFVRIKPNDWFYAQAATLDAQGKKKHTQFDTAFHDEAWYNGYWEFGFTPEWDSPKGPMPGRYRFGMWYSPKRKAVFHETLGGYRKQRYEGDDVGFYVGFDQMLWKEQDDPDDEQGLGLFARYGHAHRDVNKASDYWSAGLSYKGLIPERDSDLCGFAVSQAIFSDLYREYRRSDADRETVYEWYYKYYLTDWLILSPDLQVITNPGGGKHDRDAIVGGVRCRIIF
jgi:porin